MGQEVWGAVARRKDNYFNYWPVPLAERLLQPAPLKHLIRNDRDQLAAANANKLKN
jgi:hypothetical protein